MLWNPERVQAGIRTATTEDLLDRLMIYRDGLEPEAVTWIAEEIERRGISAADAEAHRLARGEVLLDRNGLPWKCSQCDAPAVVRGWGWHWWWGWMPVFPRRFRWCVGHAKEPRKE